jgi:hypothetical protein
VDFLVFDNCFTHPLEACIVRVEKRARNRNDVIAIDVYDLQSIQSQYVGAAMLRQGSRPLLASSTRLSLARSVLSWLLLIRWSLVARSPRLSFIYTNIQSFNSFQTHFPHC